MLGEKQRKLLIGKLTETLACILLLSCVLDLAKGQVVIVESKLKSNRGSSKGKSRSKPKQSIPPARVPEASIEPRFQFRPSQNLQPLTFVVNPPVLQPGSTLNLELASLSALPVPKLVNYEFEVLTADNRGRVLERRAESSRYFDEGLSGGVLLEMVEIPGGAFMMGTQNTDPGGAKKEYVRGIEKEIKEALVRRLQWETPQHLVKIQNFYMSKFEVTQAQWRAVASLPKINRELMSDPSHFKGGNRPVEKVSWEEAIEFCERLSRATGRRYRLPTEAEWEYACRAGTNTSFHSGESIKSDWANYHGKQTYGASPRGANREQTVPVGSLGVANAFGLYDMHGNVWEWCIDSWHDSYSNAPEDGRGWESGGILYLRILRGGSWDSTAAECRSNSRNRMTSNMRLNNIGFRVVAEGYSQQQTNEVRITLQ